MINGTTIYAVNLQEPPVDIKMKAFTLHAAGLLEAIGIDPTGIFEKDKDVLLTGPSKHLTYTRNSHRYLWLDIVQKN